MNMKDTHANELILFTAQLSRENHDRTVWKVWYVVYSTDLDISTIFIYGLCLGGVEGTPELSEMQYG